MALYIVHPNTSHSNKANPVNPVNPVKNSVIASVASLRLCENISRVIAPKRIFPVIPSFRYSVIPLFRHSLVPFVEKVVLCGGINQQGLIK